MSHAAFVMLLLLVATQLELVLIILSGEMFSEENES